MFFGVFTGTFSSIYIASPVLMAIEKRWPGQLARGHLSPRRPGAGGRNRAAASHGKPRRRVSLSRRVRLRLRPRHDPRC